MPSAHGDPPQQRRPCRHGSGAALGQAAVPGGRMSDVEAEVADVAVLDHVVAALQAHPALLLGPLLAAEPDEVVVGDDLGADEAALEIGVDHARRLRGGGTPMHGPGTRLLGADGEEGEQAQQLVALRGSPG